MSLVSNFLSSFVLGLLTPLTAVCVLPLYPAFLTYLTNRLGQDKGDIRKRYALFGLLITLGVVFFMFLLGLLFTTVLQISLTRIIGIVSPIAFGILSIISILLIFGFDMGNFMPRVRTVQAKNPVIDAVLYGFFFGAIVIPCNPAFISAFFARALLFDNFFGSMLNFIFFGLGLGFPLLAFSLTSANWSKKIIGFLMKKKRIINLAAGLVMLSISVYYLVFVFNVFSFILN